MLIGRIHNVNKGDFMRLIILLMILSLSCFSKTIVLEKGNFVLFNGEVDDSSVGPVKREVFDLINQDNFVETKEIYLVLNTPGGDVSSGIDMIEFITALPVKIPTITMFAASMGFQFAENLGHRYILESGILMAHKMSGGVQGEISKHNGQLENRLKLWEDRQERMDQVCADRAKMSIKAFQALMENEYWCEGQSCVDKGFADEVVKVSCGKSLIGFEQKTVIVEFMGMSFKVNAKFPNCPLLSPYDVKIVNGNEEKNLGEMPADQQKAINNALGIGLKNSLK